MFKIRQRSCLPTALRVGQLQESCPESPDPQVIDKRLVLEHVGKDVSGFGVMRLSCELRQRIL
jgi:hypothetical protein